jgi:hypothetical protein
VITLSIYIDDQNIAKTMAASSEATTESDPKEFAELAAAPQVSMTSRA